MKHLSQPDLADYARSVWSPSQQDVESHLSQCSRCRQDLSIWQGVSATSARMNASIEESTENAVRMVKAAFALHRPRKRSRVGQFATLVFDSWLTPVSEGVRTAATAARNNVRQMIFRSGPVVADLRLEPHGASGWVVMVGQVLSLSRESVQTPAIRVILEQGRTALAAAVGNEFGEFVLEYEEKDDLRLRLEVLGQKPLFIPLDLAVQPSAGLARGTSVP